MARERTVIHKLPKGPGADLAHTLARNASALRAARGLSLDQLALMTGLGKRTLQRVEGPEAIADLNTLALIAAALQHPPSALLL